MEDVNVLYVVVGKHCPPCNMQHEVIKNMDLALEVVFVDAEDAGDLIDKYQLRTTPSLIMNGQVLRGFTPEDPLNEFIGEYYEG